MEYQRIPLDANVARTNEEVLFDKEYSNFMFLVNDVAVEYKVNDLKADSLFTGEVDGFENNVGRFRKLFITHKAGTGKIVLLAYR